MLIIEWAASAPPWCMRRPQRRPCLRYIRREGRMPCVAIRRKPYVCPSPGCIYTGYYGSRFHAWGVLYNGFPATTARPALILRINGYRTYTLFSLCNVTQMATGGGDQVWTWKKRKTFAASRAPHTEWNKWSLSLELPREWWWWYCLIGWEKLILVFVRRHH